MCSSRNGSKRCEEKDTGLGAEKRTGRIPVPKLSSGQVKKRGTRLRRGYGGRASDECKDGAMRNCEAKRHARGAERIFTAEASMRARRKADVRQTRGLCFALAVTLEISSAGRETESSRFFRIHWAALISLRKTKRRGPPQSKEPCDAGLKETIPKPKRTTTVSTRAGRAPKDRSFAALRMTSERQRSSPQRHTVRTIAKYKSLLPPRTQRERGTHNIEKAGPG